MTAIKRLDTNHLVMDGYNAFDDRPIREASLTDPDVDIVTSHHYATDPSQIFKHIETNLNIVKSRKPYVIGEFGFVGTPVIQKVLDWVIDKEICGALIWSLRYHRSHGGFYWHSEPLGLGVYKAYHWPGFESGEEYDEKNLVALMRKKGFEIRGLPVPPRTVPDAPTLLPIKNVTHISWRGSAGAASYNVERSETPDGPWIVVGHNVSDAAVQYMDLFQDMYADIGHTYYYRVLAENEGGQSKPSNLVGPVTVKYQALIDEMAQFARLYDREGEWQLSTDNDRRFKEDINRLEGKSGSVLVYRVPGPITGWKIYSFSQVGDQNMTISLSNDTESYQPVQCRVISDHANKGDYGYWNPMLIENDGEIPVSQYLKIRLSVKTQISRVEIFFGLENYLEN